MAKLDPAQFVREVRSEVAKVTWPTRKETLITTGLVLGMSALAAVFFLVVDQVVALAMRATPGDCPEVNNRGATRGRALGA